MWFRNLQLYLLTKPFGLSEEELGERLQVRRSQECGTLDLFSDGWELPLGSQGSQLTHSVGDCTMICLRRLEKVLPAAVVNDALKERLEVAK